jgi:formylglycine-generating enzyme required for sulfatase activity
MAGNVYEWTADTYDKGGYSGEEEVDPAGAAVGPFRIVRGGGWGYPPWHLRSSFRGFFEAEGFWTATVGSRCARDTTALGYARTSSSIGAPAGD